MVTSDDPTARYLGSCIEMLHVRSEFPYVFTRESKDCALFRSTATCVILFSMTEIVTMR